MIEVKQITQNEINDGQPTISQKGDISWEAEEGSLYYFEYQPQTGYDTAITEETSSLELGPVVYQESHPDLDYQSEAGSSVVYEHNGDVVLWNSTSGSTTIAMDEVPEGKAKIYGDYVAYEYGEPGSRDIYLYNHQDGSTTNLTPEPGDYYNVDIHNGYITYEQDDGQTKNVYGYDIATETTNPLGVFANDAKNPHVWQTQESAKVVYEFEAAPGNNDIYYYDSLTGATLSIGSAGNEDLNPYVAGNYIVWQGYDGNDYEIYSYNTANQETTQVTDNTYDDTGAKVSAGGDVVYQSESQTIPDYHDIYLYDGTTSTNLGSGPISPDNPIDYEISKDKVTWEAWDGTDWEIYAGEIV